MTESTGHGPTRSASYRARRLGGSTADRNIVVFGLGLLFCALLIAVLPDLSPVKSGLISERAHGRITALLATGDAVAPQASVLILDGARRGVTVSAILESPTSQAEIPRYQAGDEVLLAIDLQPDGSIRYSVIDRWRAPILLTIVGALALLTIAIAGWRGLRALTSLAITVVVVIRLLIPLLLGGYSPVGLAIGLGILITVLSLLLTQGVSRPTFAAIAGTAVGLVVTGILAILVSSAAQFTSAQGSEEVAAISQIAGGTIELSGLLLAAVIFGGLGVLNDVAITQAVTIDEFRAIDPTMSRRELYRRAMSVGTAHLAATVNTLVFAYLGSALPVIVLLALQIHRLDLAINDEHIAVEVVRTVVGAIGVLSAVPLTTAIAALWAGPAGRPVTTPRWIMAMPLPGAAVDGRGVGQAAVAPAAAAVASPSDVPAPRKRNPAGALRRLLPKRRKKKSEPVDTATDTAVASSDGAATPPQADETEAGGRGTGATLNVAAGSPTTQPTDAGPTADTTPPPPRRKAPAPRSAAGATAPPQPKVDPKDADGS